MRSPHPSSPRPRRRHRASLLPALALCLAAPAQAQPAPAGPTSMPGSAASGIPTGPTPAATAASAADPAGITAPAYAPSLRCTGEGRCTLRRAELKALVADPTPLLRELRLVPTDGRPKTQNNPRAAGMGPTRPGLRVFGLREDSIFHRLGVRNHDVLVSLNGYWLNDPVSTMLAVNALGGALDIRMQVDRFGATEPLNFVLIPTDL